MKWFKHENTFNNPKVKLLKRKHKAQGYAVYFQILELIGESLDKSNIDEWFFLPDEYSNDLMFLADELGVEKEELENILSTCYELNLLQEVDGRIRCSQLKERADEYTEKILKQQERISTVSGQYRESVGTTSGIRIEQNRIEKNKNIKEKINKKESLSDKTSKNSITPCTPDELVEISETLKVPLDVVERKHQRILEMLETKEFNKRKYKTIFYTLKSWIDLDIQRGFIKKPMGVISI